MDSVLRRPLAIGMLALAGFVFFAVFEGPPRTSPAFPALIPVFGAPFGVLFIVGQIVACITLRMRRGLVLVAVIWAVAALLTLGSSRLGLPAPEMGLVDRLFTGSACASAIALGIAMLREWT